MGILLDTSGYTFMIKNHPGVMEALADAEVICMTPIVLGELKAGFRKGARPERNEEQLHGFLEKEEVQILLLDRETAERYAVIYDFLRKSGTPVSPNDLWIAASAMQHGLRVLTTDRDYLKIPQILVDLFEPS